MCDRRGQYPRGKLRGAGGAPGPGAADHYESERGAMPLELPQLRRRLHRDPPSGTVVDLGFRDRDGANANL
jgi:hypothetical protein